MRNTHIAANSRRRCPEPRSRAIIVQMVYCNCCTRFLNRKPFSVPFSTSAVCTSSFAYEAIHVWKCFNLKGVRNQVSSVWLAKKWSRRLDIWSQPQQNGPHPGMSRPQDVVFIPDVSWPLVLGHGFWPWHTRTSRVAKGPRWPVHMAGHGSVFCFEQQRKQWQWTFLCFLLLRVTRQGRFSGKKAWS